MALEVKIEEFRGLANTDAKVTWKQKHNYHVSGQFLLTFKKK